MLFELATAITQTSAAPCELRREEIVFLADNYVRMRDVIVLPCGGDGQFTRVGDLSRVGDLVIAAIPDGSSRLSVSRAGVADLVRRRVPALAGLQVSDEEGVITFERAAPSKVRTATGGHCFVAARDIAPGDLVKEGSVSKTPCTSAGATAKLTYDRKQAVVRASSAIHQGDYLGRLMPPSSSAWDRNQPLTMKIRIGPVTVEREVRAMEAAEGDASIFVKDADGEIFPAPVSVLVKSEVRHD